MNLKILLPVLLSLLLAVQTAYADYYTQSLTLGTDESEYKENFINTTQSSSNNSVLPYNTIQYVQPVIYPAYYTTPQIVTYRTYPYSYLNYNKGGLSLGYNNGGLYNNQPQTLGMGGTKIYKVGPSYGREYNYGSSINTIQGFQPNYNPIKPSYPNEHTHNNFQK